MGWTEENGKYTVTHESEKHLGKVEVFDEDTLKYFGDPRCPWCTKAHKRKRIDLTLTFVVDVPESCKKKKGFVQPAKLTIPERLAIVLADNE